MIKDELKKDIYSSLILTPIVIFVLIKGSLLFNKYFCLL